MPGSADYQPSDQVDLSSDASAFVVARYDRDAGETTVLPNVMVLSIHFQEGPVVPTAQFRYVMDSSDPESPFPNTVGQVWPLDAAGDYVVLNDDELLVYEYTATGERVLVFDGFAQIPQVDQGEDSLDVTFVAEGVGVRLRDTPIGGAVYMDSDKATSQDVANLVLTDLPTHFNPTVRGRVMPNKTKDGKDTDDVPFFLDHRLTGSPVPQSPWTLGDLVTYLCAANDEKFVVNPVGPDGEAMDKFLVSYKPKSGDTFNIADPSTFETAPIVVRSFDATGMTLVEAIAKQLHYHKFEVAFNLREDDQGAPLNELIVYRKDGLDGAEPVELFFPEADQSLADSGIPDFSAIGLVRDGHGAANEFEIETDPVEYEASFVLAPGFKIDPADANAISSFDRSKLANAPQQTRDKYRLYVLDEDGSGHWSYGDSKWQTGLATSLDDVLGKPAPPADDPRGEAVRRYAHRRRPAAGNDLFSDDDAGRPLRAELAICTDYTGPTPAVWSGTGGTWRSLADNGWNLLRDRLGIEIIADNPETWRLPKANSSQTPGDTVRGVTAQAAPVARSGSNPGNPRFYLLLTCVIPADLMIDALAAKRDAAPTQFAIRRRIDCKDHFKKQVVKGKSRFNTASADQSYDTLKDATPGLSPRDDTNAALAHAQALRTAHEMPLLAGGFSVPWITHAIGLGDLISRINGMEVDLSMSAGGPAGESPLYPVVVGYSYMCQEPQSTVFKLSDRRSEVERV